MPKIYDYITDLLSNAKLFDTYNKVVNVTIDPAKELKKLMRTELRQENPKGVTYDNIVISSGVPIETNGFDRKDPWGYTFLPLGTDIPLEEQVLDYYTSEIKKHRGIKIISEDTLRNKTSAMTKAGLNAVDYLLEKGECVNIDGWIVPYAAMERGFVLPNNFAQKAGTLTLNLREITRGVQAPYGKTDQVIGNVKFDITKERGFKASSYVDHSD